MFWTLKSYCQKIVVTGGLLSNVPQQNGMSCPKNTLRILPGGAILCTW
jgi:hypothetical protein